MNADGGGACLRLRVDERDVEGLVAIRECEGEVGKSVTSDRKEVALVCFESPREDFREIELNEKTIVVTLRCESS